MCYALQFRRKKRQLRRGQTFQRPFKWLYIYIYIFIYLYSSLRCGINGTKEEVDGNANASLALLGLLKQKRPPCRDNQTVINTDRNDSIVTHSVVCYHWMSCRFAIALRDSRFSAPSRSQILWLDWWFFVLDSIGISRKISEIPAFDSLSSVFQPDRTPRLAVLIVIWTSEIFLYLLWVSAWSDTPFGRAHCNLNVRDFPLFTPRFSLIWYLL